MTDQIAPHQKTGLPELLAPAGSPEALAAAVNAGADAVYLAGRRFGARQYAANFSGDDLKGAIDFAHLRNVRVYVTVNTLIRDAELADVAGYLLSLYEAGADALLVQDIGVAALAREILPDLPLHASTQMTIHNREGVAWAKREGFSRVVLARELGIEEIEDIAGYPGTEGMGLEVFVHGALCYCYSGQCLLSSVIGGRSGNRGMCAQPCRKPYRLVTGGKDEYGRPESLHAVPLEEHYLLSTRDLAAYPFLDRLVRAPVESLKIEGRMRSPEYVATVVSIYRRALDAIAAGLFAPSPEDLRDLALAFNREFTGGYISGSAGIMSRSRPGNRGLLLGRVSGYNPRTREATVCLEGGVRPGAGDGLAFCTDDPERDVGTVVRGTPAVRDGRLRIPLPAPVEEGCRVYLTKSPDFEERAKRIIEQNRQAVPLDVTVRWQDGRPCLEARLTGLDGRPLSVRYTSDLVMEAARSRPLAPERIAEQFGKVGGTTFTLRSLDLRYPGGLFAPLGELNRIRRAFLDRVEESLLASGRPGSGALADARERTEARIARLGRQGGPERSDCFPSVSIYVDTLAAARAAISAGADTIYLEPCIPPGTGSADLIGLLTDTVALANGCSGEIVWKWPAITRREFLDEAVPLLPLLYEQGLGGVMVSGVGAAEAVIRSEPGMRVFGAAGLNVWNHLTLRRLHPAFCRCTLSPEVPADDMGRLVKDAGSEGGAPEIEVIVQGNIEALVSENRLVADLAGASPAELLKDRFWGIEDPKNRIFPVRCDGEMRTYIANAVETCLIDRLPDIIRMGIDAVAIDGRGRGPCYAGEMADLYRAGIDAVKRGHYSRLSGLKEKAKDRSLGGITGGHFVRGLAEGDTRRG